ncbi:SPOR domain-containing protein [Sphingomonas sp. HDW15A]|uniref:SPOR domain-containing protein n=1 Tax=Sphingomonas sp. HDW15A TaxID=2714942 RepID=UPI00140CA59A|nr:SPOR domain-containing protein [Sphingomonas sp. HDW15A]QIK96584.1 SPOR domain-containing protein [Sphingomonas sp. HDW15A]
MQSDGEALPWLEAVDDEDEPRGLSAAKMLAALALVLAGIAIVVVTLFYIGREQGGSGPPELIRAPQGPYKMKPTDPGGLDVSGESGTAFATGAGVDTDSALDVSRMDEPPPPPPAKEGEPMRKPPNEAKEPVEPQPAPTPAGPAGSTVQLGAYGSTAKAETAWKMLSVRFPEVAALSKQVVPYNGGYRLRATAGSPAQAKAACSAVAAGGENCFVVR